MSLNILEYTPLVLVWSERFVISAKHGCVMDGSVFKHMLALVLCKMQFVSNASEEFGSMVVAFSNVHFVMDFYAKMINLSTKRHVKFSNRRISNARAVTDWVSILVCVVKPVTVKITYEGKDSNTRRIKLFRVQNVTMRHQSQKI